jgi:HD superfamily phosphohydrolase
VNKRKIINDPVYGFITIKSELLYDIIEHPYFQRLRRIRQLGLTNLVYPGATHTRFQHAIGAMHLMDMALNTIKSKGHVITDEEHEAAMAAILLHDIGHGPYSHTLENSIIEGLNHEALSLILMKELNNDFNNKLDLAIKIFSNDYHKHFLHELISGQLDMDRMDYLKRDVFFTGVYEGVIGSDRIIKMLDVVDDQLVVEAKGIYSIEKFLIARRLMYWQVYFHKTVLSAEILLNALIRRAKDLIQDDKGLLSTPALAYFLNIPDASKTINQDFIKYYNQLDDADILASAKMWLVNEDKILSKLSSNLLNRKLFKIELRNEPIESQEIKDKIEITSKVLSLDQNEAKYFVYADSISNHAYSYDGSNIRIQYKDKLIDISEASDIFHFNALTKVDKKYYLCYPKDILKNNI